MPLSRQPLLLIVTLAFLSGLNPVRAEEPLDSLLSPIHPEIRKWATVIRVKNPDTAPEFSPTHFADSKDSVAFWPASTIKLYTVIAVLEWMNTNRLPEDTSFTYSRQTPHKTWITDCSRTFTEMMSEVFRRSSNEDYTLLLRTLGIDAINTSFLIPAKGFPHSALMRDYVTYRPAVYENEEPQRIRATTPEGSISYFEHRWSGTSYAAQRGATALSSTTGNCTSTAELADCLRRLIFHKSIPAAQRFAITEEQARFLCEGDPDRGVVGLENRLAGAYGWQESGEVVFPNARFYHKAGLISTYALDVCYLSDTQSNNHLVLSLAAHSGEEQVIRDMARTIYEAAKIGKL